MKGLRVMDWSPERRLESPRYTSNTMFRAANTIVLPPISGHLIVNLLLGGLIEMEFCFIRRQGMVVG